MLIIFRFYCCASLQPSLLAMALLCFEAQEQHDPRHTDKISEILTSLQQLLNVSPERSENLKSELWKTKVQILFSQLMLQLCLLELSNCLTLGCIICSFSSAD